MDDYFLEHCQVHNNFYGVSYEAWNVATKLSKIPILEIDINGAKTIREKSVVLGIFPKYLFVAPPSITMLEERLVKRGSESPEDIELRLHNAAIEIEEAKRCDFFDSFITNSDFEKASQKLFRLTRDW